MDVIIEKAQKKDVNGVYVVLLEMIKSENACARKVSPSLMKQRIKRSDFEASAQKELLRSFKEKNSRFLVAKVDGKVVGYARGSIVKNKDPFFKTVTTGYLHALAVLKKYTKKGIASLLYEKIETWFKENKCSHIYLEVFEHNNAIKIYDKWGYVSCNNKNPTLGCSSYPQHKCWGITDSRLSRIFGIENLALKCGVFESPFKSRMRDFQ